MSEKFEKLNDFERELFEGIKNNAKGRSKYCIYNAIHHLEMAFKIKELDPEMALIRAITAEEEVARAIFIIIKDHGYKNANKIKDMEHKYKQSLSIFIGLIQNFFYNNSKKEIFPFESNISLRLDKEQFLQLKIKLKKIDKSFSPIPPLNFSLLVNDEDYCFKNELDELIFKSDFQDFQKLIKKEINLRNEILYANDKGRTVIINGLDVELEKYYKVVFKLIIIYSLIYPYRKKKSFFIQNALNSYLSVMMKVKL
ncbi:hypothetical protein KO488_11015 [Poseidonibacter lekithochrous]|uniref:hypothetical protein n=1 Tax=Poseidonibacter TaxID=2321187 RepID=UPI001C0A1E9C|nr:MULTISPECIES: hypothetical protein [Poseidonibacter]MBU3015291.1 hypothetical protein [Poseidonibacter lekithochrous]MDO6828589.1 hypothetical protein [Poseidonibacter sp. 1_MG-2023]